MKRSDKIGSAWQNEHGGTKLCSCIYTIAQIFETNHQEYGYWYLVIEYRIQLKGKGRKTKPKVGLIFRLKRLKALVWLSSCELTISKTIKY